MKSLFLYFIFLYIFHFGFLFSIFPQLFSVEANIPFFAQGVVKVRITGLFNKSQILHNCCFSGHSPGVCARRVLSAGPQQKPACTPLRGTGRFLPNFITVFLPHRAKFTADRPCEATGQAAAKTQGQSSTCSWSVLTTITPLMTFTLPVDGQFGISWNSCVSRMARYSS